MIKYNCIFSTRKLVIPMKKILALLLALAMILSLCACGTETDPAASTPETTGGQPDPTGTSTQTEPTGNTVGSEPTQPSGEAPCVHELEVVHTQNSTCTEPGLMILECTLCGYKITQESTALGHSFTDATCTKGKTCTVCGVAEGDALGHHYVSGKCDRCGAKMPGYEEKPSSCSHNYKISQQKAPTCTEKGSFTYSCSACGDSYVETTEANGHHFSDATCDKPQTCTVCAATEGKSLGHSYSNYRCTRCGTEDPNKPTAFTVTIRSDKGKTIEGVTVTVYVDGASTPAGSAKTGSNGKATIPMDGGSSYKVILSDIPTGFTAKESYTFKSMITNINLISVSYTTPTDHSNGNYKVGSTMGEFTLTDTDGIRYTLSDLLKDKDMVILNFWFVACAPCKAEFPYLEAIHNNYENVQLLTMSHWDSEDSIKELRQQMGVTFPMIREDIGFKEGFGLIMYPTTVFIDSSGKILKIDVGGYKSEQELVNIIEAFLR